MRQIVGLVLVLVLGACTSSAGGAPGSAGGGGNAQLPADPCSVLTLDELKTATGTPFQPGVKSSTATTADCQWTQQGSAGVLNLGFMPLDPDAYSVLTKGSANTAVPGVGDQAYLVPLISSIDVAKGGLNFTVQPVLTGGGDWKQIATALAKLVASRVGN